MRSGLDDLDAPGSDPRGVVIGCWLALERAAAAVGLARRDTDSPTDLVTRLLAGADVPAPVLGDLAALYRAARYAPDEVSESSRDAARQALTDVAQALERAARDADGDHPLRAPAGRPLGPRRDRPAGCAPPAPTAFRCARHRPDQMAPDRSRVGVLGSLVAWVVLRAVDRVAVPLLLLFGIALVVAALVVALKLVRRAPALVHVGGYADPTPFGLPVRPYARARRFEERLDLVRGDARHFVEVVLPELGAIADERLLVTRGFTRASDPEAAAAALGERLRRFLDDTTRTRAPSVAELTAVVDDLEAL